MRYAVDPRQTALFEPASAMFSPMTIKYLSSDWPGVFRHPMLHLMPAAALGEPFDAKLGGPPKELHGLAGAIFLKEFFHLTLPRTVERYLTDAAWQYALNVNPMEASLSHATVERDLKWFAESDLAREVFHQVTSALDDARVSGRSRDRAMERVLHEQCDVQEETVQLKKKTGGNVMQDPLDAQDRKPEILYADGPYGRDAHGVHAAERGVDLQSPVAGAPQQNPDDLTIDDFVVGEETQTIERCPNGHEPVSSVHDSGPGRTRTVMEASQGSACPCRNPCPVKKNRDESVIEHTPAEHRRASRRAEQATDAFRANDAIRGGGESVNAGLKRKTGWGRLRVRGSPRVRMAVWLRCAGWNRFRALTAMKQRGIAGFAAFFAALAPLRPLVRRLKGWIEVSDCFGRHKTAPERQIPMLAAA